MKIKQIHIENFGTLSKIDLNLKENANFLLRDNAWGKTTLAVFLKVMFYGFSHENKNDETVNERLRYEPWQGGVYGGSIVFAIGSKEYRLSKIFGKKKNEDKFALYDAKSNLVSKDFGAEPGMEIFGIDKDSFLKTIYVSGNESDLSVTSNIQAKLMDISIFDGDIQKYDRIRDRIKKEKMYLNPNRKTGEIQKMYRHLSMLKANLSRKDLDEERLFELKEEIAKLEFKREDVLERLRVVHSELDADEKKGDFAEGEEDRKIKDAASEDVMSRDSDTSGDEVDDTIASPKDTEDLQAGEDAGSEDEYAEDAGSISVVGFVWEKLSGFVHFLLGKIMGLWKKLLQRLHLDKIEPMEFLLTLRDELLDLYDETMASTKELAKDILILFAIIYMGFIVQRIVWGDGDLTFGALSVMFFSAIALTCFMYVVLRLTAYRKLDPEKYGKDAAKKRKEKKAEAAKKAEEARKAEEAKEAEEAAKSEEAAKKQDGASGWEDAGESNEAKDSDDEEKKEQDTLRKLQLKNDLLEEEKQILEELLVVRQEKIELSEKIAQNIEMEKEFYEVKKKYALLKQRFEVLTSTQYFLDQAKLNYASKYMGPIKSAFDKYFGLFTKNVMEFRLSGQEDIENTVMREHLVMDANLDIQIDSNGVLHSTKVLSDGYKDVVGLCKRFALMDIMYQKERPPIILDDPFVNLDDQKIRAAMRFLMDLSKEGQVLYFTCNHSRFPKV